MEFEELLQSARGGHAAALGELMEAAATFCWRVLGRFNTLSAATREDLAHEVVVILLDRGLQQFRGSTEIQWKAFLKQTAVNQAISLMRRDKYDIEPFWSLDEDISPDLQVEEEEAFRKLIDCTAELSAQEHEIFWMRLRELSYDEMVKRLGLAQGTIASKYHRAQQKVKNCMQEVGFG